MPSVFISYAREDAAKAKAIATAVEQASFDVWFDERISGGSEYSREIEGALKAAAAVVVLWSRHSVDSPWVRDEAAEGRDSGRLVPLLIDDSRPPIGFRQFQTTDLSKWSGRGLPKNMPEVLAAIASKAGKPVPETAKPGPVKTRSSPLVWGAIAALVLVLAGVSVYFWLGRGSGGPLTKPTVALQPFTATSGDAALQDLAAQARDSASHALAASGIPVRSLDKNQTDSRATDFMLAGDVSRTGDKLVATVHLDDTVHGLTVFSRQFEGKPGEADFPERIGAQIAGTIAWAAPLIALERRHPSDPGVLADLFHQLDFLGDPLEQYQYATRAAARAPDSAFAQISAAFDTAFNLEELPSQERAPALAAARKYSARGLELAPEFGDAHATWCFLHSPIYLKECEDRLLEGKRSDPDAPFVNSFLARLMRNVGRVSESIETTRLSYTHDPYVPTKIAWMLLALELSGDDEAARQLHAQGRRWWPEFDGTFARNRLGGLIQRGDFAAIARLQREVGPKVTPAVYAMSGRLDEAVRNKSLPNAKSACADLSSTLVAETCMLALAKLGDEDSSFAIADKLFPRRLGRTAAETDQLWLQNDDGTSLDFATSAAAAPMRTDPRYLSLAARTGLLRYWRSGRLPDFCRPPTLEPVCAKIKA